jgi:hypothetical protein
MNNVTKASQIDHEVHWYYSNTDINQYIIADHIPLQTLIVYYEVTFVQKKILGTYIKWIVFDVY